MLGRRSALASVGGNPRMMHSLPGYYGWHGAIVIAFLPALAVLTIWLIAQPLVIERQLAGFFPAEPVRERCRTAPLLMADVRRVALGLDTAVAAGRDDRRRGRLIVADDQVDPARQLARRGRGAGVGSDAAGA